MKRKLKLKPGQKPGETARQFQTRQRTASKAGTVIPGSWGGSRWDGRKKFKSKKKGDDYVNHQGRPTITALIFGLVRDKKNHTDKSICAAVKRRFPTARFNEDPKKYLGVYKLLEKQDRAGSRS